MKLIWLALRNWIIFKLSTEREVCESCEYLKLQIEIMRTEKDKLLASIIKTPEGPTIKFEMPQGIHPGSFKPWRVKQAELEKKDKELAAQNLKSSPVVGEPDKVDTGINGTDVQSIEELETEMGIPNTGSQSNA